MIGIITQTLVKTFTVLLVSSFLNVTVTSASMENTLEAGSSILALKNNGEEMEFNRYDIVVFHCPLDETQIYIKRIVGLPGEYVEIKEGKIYINHSVEPISEKYIKEKWETDNSNYTFEVPENAFLLLGDNRNNSIDARHWGNMLATLKFNSAEEEANASVYVKKEQIIAKAFLKYYPQIEFVF